ncbi:polysaccharide deacetylase [bacterium]|nr:polysaccharide deacetylase [bacterium]NBW57542.1 polysaccharide deacetylase [bacterium]NBX71696.1 polysaccharide deacetylase [bacterium]
MAIRIIYLFFISFFLYAGQNHSKSITDLQYDLTKKYGQITPVIWTENVLGISYRIKTEEKVIALTFDACGSPKSDGKGNNIDDDLINFLIKENIKATLFMNGRWIDVNKELFKQLASNPLFEIGNHGLHHKPASVNGKMIYGEVGSKNIAELVEEIEGNARKIENITGKRPKFYRSGTAYYDEVAVKVARDLDHEVAGFSVIGDAGTSFSATTIKNILLKAKAGDIILYHINHPESQVGKALIEGLPLLKKKGFKFVRLSDVQLETLE